MPLQPNRPVEVEIPGAIASLVTLELDGGHRRSCRASSIPRHRSTSAGRLDRGGAGDQDLRREYASQSLTRSRYADPIRSSSSVCGSIEALTAQLIDANAMSLATASAAGEPSVRTVLLKGRGRARASCSSRTTTARRAATWRRTRAPPAVLLARARATGDASPGRVAACPREVSEAYFAHAAAREPMGGLGRASEFRSRPIATTLERQFADVKRRFADQPVPCPPDWGGYRVRGRADGVLAGPPRPPARSPALHAPGRWHVDANAAGAVNRGALRGCTPGSTRARCSHRTWIPLRASR